MDCSFTSLPYKQTGFSSPLIIDYIGRSKQVQSFYTHPVSSAGIEAAIKARQSFSGHRSALINHLKKQYKDIESSETVRANIELLGKENTFTICTAHQPAIFTGTLYFIYKILHAIKLAEHCKQLYPSYHFVPVFWMGSEDADLDELGKIYLSNEKIEWDTKQTGAVGRMQTKGLDKILHRIAGELSVQPFGKELVDLLKECYLQSTDLQTATFRLLHNLFSKYGLIVLLPDSPEMKQIMQPVFEDDLFRQLPSTIINNTIDAISRTYKVQANPRPINLFYLKDGLRERIEQVNEDEWQVVNTNISFSKQQLLDELNKHPGCFSPNVILRGLYQEIVLPNIAFIGGGGELAYWLEFKALFEHYQVPFPVLVIRNSFLVIEKKWKDKMERMGFSEADIFKEEQQLLTELISRHRNGQLKLANEMASAEQLYHRIKDKAAFVDKTLQQHVDALKARALKPLEELEKKLLRAEKRKFETEMRQIHQVKQALFPQGGLQERIENFMPWYAKWGPAFIELLYNHSLTLEQEFGVLSER